MYTRIPICYDVETTGLQRLTNKIFAFSTGDAEGNTQVHRFDRGGIRANAAQKCMDKLWIGESANQYVKIMHNKLDLGFTEQWYKTKLVPREFMDDLPIHDTMIMSLILQNTHPSHALDDLAFELANYTKAYDAAIKPFTRGGKPYNLVPEILFTPYQKADAERGMLLFLFFWEKIQANPKWLEIYKWEVSLLPITIDMENRGLVIDRVKCQNLIAKLRNDATDVLAKIETVTGKPLKPGTNDFHDYVFKELKYLALKRSKKTDKESLNKDFYAHCREHAPHPVLDLAQQYDSWRNGASKLTTYLNNADADGALHPNISTNGAKATGRESCSNPALQQVAKEQVLLNPYPIPARTVFKPRKNFVNFHIDFGGQEARILTHYSQEPLLLQIANQGHEIFGHDLHLPATLIFWGDKYRNGSKEAQKIMRTASKNTNFSIAYGAAIAKAASTLGLPVAEVAIGYTLYKKLLPRYCNLCRDTMDEVNQTGGVTTAFGRFLRVPRSLAYKGINTKVQGTGAEQLKRGQVKVAPILQRETSGEMQLLMPIHDELIIECPRKRLRDAVPVLRKVAAALVDFGNIFSLPFEVEIDVCTTDWQHKRKFSLE